MLQDIAYSIAARRLRVIGIFRDGYSHRVIAKAAPLNYAMLISKKRDISRTISGSPSMSYAYSSEASAKPKLDGLHSMPIIIHEFPHRYSRNCYFTVHECEFQ
jgi:hypothetical protein